MMPREMPSFASSAHKHLSSSVPQPCQHNFPAWPARQRTSLMRKKIELARQGFRLLQLQSHSGAHVSPAAWSDARQAYRRTDRQCGQVRCVSGESVWEFKRKSDRDKQEAARQLQNRSRNVNTSSSPAASKHSVVGQASAARAEPQEALRRAHGPDPAQRSSDCPSLNAAQHGSMPVFNRPSSQWEATAPYADELSEDGGSQQDSLHSSSFGQLSSLKVKTAIVVLQGSNSACRYT